MQEVWFAVARDAERYGPTARFTTWLFTIAHNRMVDAMRAKREHSSLEKEQLTSDPAAGPLAAAEARDQTAALRQAIEELPTEQRDAFLLQVEGGLSVEDMAAITRSSFETIKSRLRYARTKLRELLREYA